MERLKLSTEIYAPQEDVYDTLVDFERYPRFCDYVSRVARRGDGTEGTRYGIEFSWWKLTHMAWSEVIDLDRPTTIEWRLIEDIDATGSWNVEDVTEDDDTGRDAVTRVTIDVEYRVMSSGSEILDLPFLVSFDWVVDKVKPLVFKEAQSVLQNLVAALEGAPRTPELQVHETPSHVSQKDIEDISS